jgi:hypothetical protein
MAIRVRSKCNRIHHFRSRFDHIKSHHTRARPPGKGFGIEV